MQKDLFHADQNYAWVLELSKKLLAHESNGEKANKTEHQINTRLFNNAFCGLLLLGYPYEISDMEAAPYFILSIDDMEYSCPVMTVSNVLREEFNQVAPDATAFIPTKGKEKRAKKTAVSENVIAHQTEHDKQNNSLLGNRHRNPENKIPETNTEDLTVDNPTGNPKGESEPERVEKAKPEPPLAPSYTAKTEKETAPSHIPDVKNHSDENKASKTPKEHNRIEPVSGALMSAGYPDLEDLSCFFTAGRNKVQDLGAEHQHDATGNKRTENRQKHNDSKEQSDITEDGAPQTDMKITPNSIVSEKTPKDPVIPPPIDNTAVLSEEDSEGNRAENIKEPENSTAQPIQDINPHIMETPHKDDADQETKEDYPHPLPSGQYFRPRAYHTVSVSEEKGDNKETVSEAPKPTEQKKGLFKLFRRDKEDKGDNQDSGSANDGHASAETTDLPSAAEPAVTETPTLTVPETGTATEMYDYSQDGGQLFQHIHQVTIKPRFGDAVVSRARFIIWPTRVITMHTGTTFADFLVHVTDTYGNEQIFCTNSKIKQLGMMVDGKQYLVYGIWNNSVFESHVVLDGKSGSMFRMEEEVQKQEPDSNFGDSFLDQFRYEHKGQPFHFIVPFLNGNRGELNIPIVGFVSIDGKKYALERCEGNTLQYRTRANAEKIIRGHWEKGTFVFTIDDATKLLWEDSPDPVI